ncbi:hypothetical protein [Neobacillus muris]|nr:hypothetical protein [Neobacillus muris]
MEKYQANERNRQGETLEISSTGYGLESVKKENKEEAEQKEHKPNCGGL